MNDPEPTTTVPRPTLRDHLRATVIGAALFTAAGALGVGAAFAVIEAGWIVPTVDASGDRPLTPTEVHADEVAALIDRYDCWTATTGTQPPHLVGEFPPGAVITAPGAEHPTHVTAPTAIGRALDHLTGKHPGLRVHGFCPR